MLEKRFLTETEIKKYQKMVDETNKIYGKYATDLECAIAMDFYEYQIIDESTYIVWVPINENCKCEIYTSDELHYEEYGCEYGMNNGINCGFDHDDMVNEIAEVYTCIACTEYNGEFKSTYYKGVKND